MMSIWGYANKKRVGERLVSALYFACENLGDEVIVLTNTILN